MKYAHGVVSFQHEAWPCHGTQCLWGFVLFLGLSGILQGGFRQKNSDQVGSFKPLESLGVSVS